MRRRTFLRAAGLGLAGVAMAPMGRAAPVKDKPNVLFICVDDLRPELGCYGREQMITPNLDKLASQGVLFNNHFVQVPTCGASRCCLLTGQRPTRPGAVSNAAFEGLPRTDTGRAFSMPRLFRENGYTTVSVGKVSHGGDGRRHGKPSSRVDENGEMTGAYAALKTPEEATDEEARKLWHGYFACVSYVDAQVGKVLDELDRLGLRDNMIVVVWGDHGWHLGDLHVWGKHTTFEFSLRSTLIVHAPGMSANGSRTDGLVETLDLYPTLADLCGLDAPIGLDGASLIPMLHNTRHLGKDGAFGYWRRHGCKAKTLRTSRYRIVRWTNAKGKVVQTELYDHQADPVETTNIAKDRPEAVTRLLAQLDAESPRLRVAP